MLFYWIHGNSEFHCQPSVKGTSESGFLLYFVLLVVLHIVKTINFISAEAAVPRALQATRAFECLALMAALTAIVSCIAWKVKGESRTMRITTAVASIAAGRSLCFSPNSGISHRNNSMNWKYSVHTSSYRGQQYIV